MTEKWWRTAVSTAPQAQAPAVSPKEAGEKPVCSFKVPRDWKSETYTHIKTEQGKPVEYEAAYAHGGSYFALTVSDKGQDALAVSTENGCTRMALGDGVSGTMFGAEAAQVCTSKGLEAIVGKVPDKSAFQAAAEGLSEHQIGPNRVNFRERALEITRDPKTPWSQQSSAAEHLKRKSLADTTLDLGVYIPTQNSIEIGMIGDSPFYVLRAETGHMESHKESDEYKMGYDPKGPVLGNPKLQKIDLKNRDIFFFASDGLTNLDKLAGNLRGATSAEAVLNILREHIDSTPIADDISVLGGIHQVQSARARPWWV